MGVLPCAQFRDLLEEEGEEFPPGPGSSIKLRTLPTFTAGATLIQ